MKHKTLIALAFGCLVCVPGYAMAQVHDNGHHTGTTTTTTQHRPDRVGGKHVSHDHNGVQDKHPGQHQVRDRDHDMTWYRQHPSNHGAVVSARMKHHGKRKHHRNTHPTLTRVKHPTIQIHKHGG